MVRFVVAVGVTLALAGCGAPANTAATSSSTTIQSTTSSLPTSSPTSPTPSTTTGRAPAVGGTPLPATAIDRIAIDTRTLPPELMFDTLRFGTVSDQLTPASSEPLPPCFFTHTGVTDSAVFGSPLAFREVRDDGFSNLFLIQAIGVYADPAAAQAAYRFLADAVDTCRASEEGARVTFGEVTATSVQWSTSMCGGADQVLQNVMARVYTCRVSAPAELTSTVAQAIKDKIGG